MPDTLKAAGITNLDKTPALRINPGAGGDGYQRIIYDFVAATVVGISSSASTYKMVRLPSTAIVNSIDIETTAAIDAVSSETVDLGVYYSDSTVDGTAQANQGNAVSVNCLVSSAAFGQAASSTWKINGLSGVTMDSRVNPLWQVAGLTTDPGGFLDIVLAVHTATASASATAGKIGVKVAYVE